MRLLLLQCLQVPDHSTTFQFLWAHPSSLTLFIFPIPPLTISIILQPLFTHLSLSRSSKSSLCSLVFLVSACVINPMASEPEVSDFSSMFDRLMRSRDHSLFIPLILGFTSPVRDSQAQEPPDQESDNNPTTPRDRFVLVNPFTQGMVVIEGSTSLENLLHEVVVKDGQPPASKASIEAMTNVAVGEDGGECAICLDEWEVGGVAKEMPCKHRFHGNCIERWLGIHGSCPVCRYKMPVEEEDVGKKRDEEGRESRRGIEREIWISFSFNSGRRSGENSTQSPNTDSNDSSSSPPRPDHGTEA